ACGLCPCARRIEEFDLALGAPDVLDAHLDRVAQPVAAPGAAADESRPEVVELEVVAVQPASRKVALEDVSEANEEAGRDDADDLAWKALLPAALIELALEQPGEADVVGSILDVRRRPLLQGSVLREAGKILGRRVV